jgi:hypothetical protein
MLAAEILVTIGFAKVFSLVIKQYNPQIFVLNSVMKKISLLYCVPTSALDGLK